MMTTLKAKQVLYFVFTVITSIWLTMADNAGLGILLFTLIQFGMLFYIIKSEPAAAAHIHVRGMWMFVPIFLLSLNAVISANGMWAVPNFFITIALYCVLIMVLLGEFSPFKEGFPLLRRIFMMILRPFRYFFMPVLILVRSSKGKSNMMVRVVIGLLISIPCMLFLVAILSSADSVFRAAVLNIVTWFFELLKPRWWFNLICGLVVGAYLFGLVYWLFLSAEQKDKKQVQPLSFKGDTVMVTIVMFCVLLVYTVFVFIQFRYLFSGASHLPGGLSYTEYARRGFFELCFLSALNVALILFYVYVTKHKAGKVSRLSKTLNIYLCAVTFVLLISSFYRMLLYSNDDGLTQLRLMVFGFLAFEAIGLGITVYYIVKPKFNMVGVYAAIALTYYLVLNIVPVDYLVAKNQVDRCLAGDNSGIAYTLTLSTDAAPQIQRLLDAPNVPQDIKEQCRRYLTSGYYGQNNGKDWRSFNIIRSLYPRVTPVHDIWWD